MTLTPEEEAAIEQAQAFVAARLDQGMGKRAVAKELARQGWPHATARQVVNEVASAINTMKGGALETTVDVLADTGEAPVGPKVKAVGDFIVGIAAIAIGALVTLVTFLAAEPGGYFWVFLGPVVYGLYRILRGLLRFLGGSDN